MRKDPHITAGVKKTKCISQPGRKDKQVTDTEEGVSDGHGEGPINKGIHKEKNGQKYSVRLRIYYSPFKRPAKTEGLMNKFQVNKEIQNTIEYQIQ